MRTISAMHREYERERLSKPIKCYVIKSYVFVMVCLLVSRVPPPVIVAKLFKSLLL